MRIKRKMTIQVRYFLPHLYIPFFLCSIDVIQGLQHDLEDGDEPATSDDLGLPHRRDPDALPPRNTMEWIMMLIHSFIMGLGGGNALFAIKAGVLTGEQNTWFFFSHLES